MIPPLQYLEDAQGLQQTIQLILCWVILEGVQGHAASNMTHTFCKHHAFVSFVEPTTIDEALGEADWILSMQDELNNFTRNQVWELVEIPKNKNVIGTKWVYRNKQDEHGIVVKNKARLVSKGYSQLEGLYYGETFAQVARLEAISILLAYAPSHKMKLFQMDVKSAFLNGFINGEVYVEQPPGFEDAIYPNC
jgi:hypothetical protein